MILRNQCRREKSSHEVLNKLDVKREKYLKWSDVQRVTGDKVYITGSSQNFQLNVARMIKSKWLHVSRDTRAENKRCFCVNETFSRITVFIEKLTVSSASQFYTYYGHSYICVHCPLYQGK
jgi:hypothetical protein